MGNNTVSSIQPYIINKEADFKSSIIMSIIIGIFIYFYVFGYKIINPYYTDWIFYQWLDVAQHYTGWLAFLHSPWQFPLLLTDKLTYPENISIFWTDSNPLFSIIFKILAPVYNYANIQFIGLYSFISLILSSVFASQIVRYFNKNVFIIILGTIFLVYKPTVLHRLVVHANLSSQFFIYACIAYILYNYKLDNFKKDFIICILLFALAVSIHFYYVPIVLSFMFLYLLYKVIYFKKIKYILPLIVSSFIVVMEMYIFGVFVNFESSKGAGVGFFSFNLNGFWNPLMGWSALIKGLPIFYDGQTDGFAYLGLGFFFLLLVCLPYIYRLIKKIYKEKWDKNFKLTFTIILIYIFGIIFIATGGIISFNNTLITSFDLSFLLSTFKGHGRFIWILPIVFTVLLYILIFKSFKTKSIIILLLAAIIIQALDIGKKVVQLNEEHMHTYSFQPIIDKNDAAKLKEYGIKHFILPVDDPLYTIKYTSFIIPNGFSESCSYTARDFRKICLNNYNNALNDVKNNLYKKDTIYIFKEADIDIPVNNKSVFYYKYGSHIILSPVELNSLK